MRRYRQFRHIFLSLAVIASLLTLLPPEQVVCLGTAGHMELEQFPGECHESVPVSACVPEVTCDEDEYHCEECHDIHLTSHNYYLRQQAQRRMLSVPDTGTPVSFSGSVTNNTDHDLSPLVSDPSGQGLLCVQPLLDRLSTVIIIS